MSNDITNDTPNTGGLFTENQSKFTTTYTLERTANHTEISIMKTQWNNICKKIHAIKINKFTLNLREVIIGASIPYIINIFSDYLGQKTPNYFPIFVCIVLLLITLIVKKFIPICNDYSAENQIRLDDLKEMIEEIDSLEKDA